MVSRIAYDPLLPRERVFPFEAPPFEDFGSPDKQLLKEHALPVGPHVGADGLDVGERQQIQ